jgi:hypothetical protein
MQAEQLFFPKFYCRGLNSKSAPKLRSGHRAYMKFSSIFGDPFFQLKPPFQGVRLLRRPRPDLRATGPGGEISIGFFTRYLFDSAFNTHLALERFPVKTKCRVGGTKKFITLTAFLICIKHKSLGVRVL